MDTKASEHPNPRQPQAQGKNLPILLDLKIEESGELTHQSLGHKVSCFSSSREVTQSSIRVGLGNFYKRGDAAAGHGLMSEPHGGERPQFSAGFRAWSSPLSEQRAVVTARCWRAPGTNSTGCHQNIYNIGDLHCTGITGFPAPNRPWGYQTSSREIRPA